MRLTFLGTGSAFTFSNYQSNMVLEVNGKTLLIDAGGDVRRSLAAVGLGYKTIDAIYISHLHADHVGGMEWLAFSTFFDRTAKKLPLYINEDIAHRLWHHCMEAGAATIQNQHTTLDTFFDVHLVPKNEAFDFAGVSFQTVRTIHCIDGFELMPSYGLLWKGKNGQKIYLPTDTQFVPGQLQSYYDWADIIFQDCETSPHKSGVHAHYQDLKTLSAGTKKKMWLYHYQDGDLPDAAADGFAGFIVKGQTFDFGNAAYTLEEAMANNVT